MTRTHSLESLKVADTNVLIGSLNDKPSLTLTLTYWTQFRDMEAKL
jgi:hypothetical protein